VNGTFVRVDSSKVPMTRALAFAVAGILAVVGAATWLLVSSFPGDSNHGYRATVTPRPPLTLNACRSELRRFGTHSGGYCDGSKGHPWFEIRLRNVSDELGYPTCTVTALDESAAPLFDQHVWFPIDFPTGPAVIIGTAIRFTWYLPDTKDDPSYVQHRPWTPEQIDRYTVSCHGQPDSQVPI
jgi:hypothetical protein